MSADSDLKFHQKHEELTELIYRSRDMLPARYVFVLTNLCNLRCPFCYQTKLKESEYMTTNDWLFLFDQIPDYARVTLTGGEPLVFRGFKKVFSSVAKKNSCNLITNGMLLNRENIELLLKFPKFKVLSISIDDIGNKVRGFSNQQWEVLKKNLKLFMQLRNQFKHNALLDIKTMVIDENAEDLLDIHRYCVEELNCDSHVFQLLKGSDIQHSDYMYSFDDIVAPANSFLYKKWNIIQQQLEKVRQYNISHEIKSFLHPKIADLNSDLPLLDLSYFNVSEINTSRFMPCKFPWSSVHVNCDGNLFPCLAVSMGNVRRNSLIEIINGVEMKKFRSLVKQSGTLSACSRCGWLRPSGPGAC